MFIKSKCAVMLAVAVLSSCAAQVRPESTRGDTFDKYLAFSTLVDSADVDPHWLGTGNRFWFERVVGGQKQTYVVDAASCETKTVTSLDQIPELAAKPAPTSVPDAPRPFRDRYPTILPPLMEVPSPDAKRFLSLKEGNVWIRNAGEPASHALTRDGVEGNGWDANDWTLLPWAKWSADGRLIATTKYDRRLVHKVPVVDWTKTEEQISFVPYPLVGDPMPRGDVIVLDAASGKQIVIAKGDDEHYLDVVGFRAKSSELVYARLSRDSKRMDVIAANYVTGKQRTVVVEEAKTFLMWTPYFMTAGAPVRLLADGQRLIFASERSGWRQFYLYDIDSGASHPITDGEYPVVDMPLVDESSGVIYYAASSDPARPYDRHLHKVSLKDGASQRLTVTGSYHQFSISPSFQYFVDRQSRVDLPTEMILRRADDGAAICTLGKTGIDRLQAVGWTPPESFQVKAADGVTDLYGVMYKPADFDPKKKYPVVEYVYGGPQIAIGQRTFQEQSDIPQAQIHWGFPRALAQRGFIVVAMDARGTPGRSKAFHDAVYRDVDQHVVDDHVAGMKQLLAQRPYLDAARVGVFGVSFGGYFTVRFMLKAGDLYKVAVASGPVEFGPEIRQSGPEGYLGLLKDNPAGYEATRNVPLASHLQGKLRIIIGTDDVNTPLSHALKLADALVRADRPFDMVVVPDANHMFSTRDHHDATKYWNKAIASFLVENLHPEMQ